ncbi:MAG: hypothetical protein JJE37_08290, partial [Methyloceanibacter sp.]|nr:hypothetical protein [Methyloceanibacter sp.]
MIAQLPNRVRKIRRLFLAAFPILDKRRKKKAILTSLRKEINKKEKTLRRIFKILDQFLAYAVKTGKTDQIENFLFTLNDEEFRRFSRVSIMGIARLFLQKQRPEAAARALNKYIQPARVDQLLYFLEPLGELAELGSLQEGLRQFLNKSYPPSSVGALECLRTAYKPVDPADHRNFQQFIIEPLSALPQDERNLMDIRFLPQQK